MREGTKVGRTVGVVTAIEELVNSRVPDIAPHVFMRGLSFHRSGVNSFTRARRSSVLVLWEQTRVAATRLAWAAARLVDR